MVGRCTCNCSRGYLVWVHYLRHHALVIRPRFTISILSMFDLAKVMRCVSSVMANSRDYNLILTDNGATDGIPEYFDALASQHSFVRVIHNPKNLGFQFPNKVALAQCATPYFVMLNDDAEVPSGWLNKIEEVFKANPRAALVGPSGSPCSLRDNFSGYVGPQVEYIEGACCACKTDVVTKLGLFPDYLEGAYLEDIALSLTVRKAGFSIHLAPFQIVHHGSQTSKRVPEVKQWVANNWAAMFKHWPDYFATRKFDGEKDCRATLVYVHVPQRPEFVQHATRFVKSYHRQHPGMDHDTVIVCNGPVSGEQLFQELPNVRFVEHNNDGWDIGAYRKAAESITTDLMLCCGSQTTFHQPGWLSRFLEAWAKHGPGLYGSTATYQIRPHLNTSGFACAPTMLLRYHGPISTKQDRYNFEHGTNAFWMQMAGLGYPVKLVTVDGEYDWQNWRRPANIYCRGDQSNCLLWFRMNHEFAAMNPGRRAFMSQISDELTDPYFKEQLKEPQPA